jgi:hypothetical protein
MMKTSRLGAGVALLALLVAAPANAQFEKFLKMLGLGDDTKVSTEEIVSGLKEALQIGTGNAVDVTGRIDGYFANEAIRIVMPEKLEAVEKGLRMAGFGERVDEFILSMNRAAENAAPAAKEIFWAAIKEMDFSDARQILDGGDTAATDYFREHTGERLGEAFRPIVAQSMDEVGVTKKYKELVGATRSIPFLKTEDVDLDAYVVARATDGLFFVLAEEESKIRKDPTARVTDLLKKVFE